MRLVCPNCTAMFDVPQKHQGMLVRCPHCSAGVKVPMPPTTAHPPLPPPPRTTTRRVPLVPASSPSPPTRRNLLVAIVVTGNLLLFCTCSGAAAFFWPPRPHTDFSHQPRRFARPQAFIGTAEQYHDQLQMAALEDDEPAPRFAPQPVDNTKFLAVCVAGVTLLLIALLVLLGLWYSQ
jgi:predicted Zn finger-like uncharacterized protein